MKVIVIGGVAAGTKAAAKLKREQPDAQVVIYTKGRDISYAGCGLPYYVGGAIHTREDLIVNTPAKYSGLTGVEVVTGQEAVALNAGAKTVTLRSTATGAEQTEGYDKLILAVGAEPFVPPVPGTTLPGVFTMRTPDDAIAARAWAEQNNCRRAVVVGGGFIGLEVAENLMARGLSVTVVDMAAQLMPNIFDPEIAAYVKRRLQAKGLQVRTSTALNGITGGDRVTGIDTDAGPIPADLVVLAIGVRPATGFLQASGLEMFKGTILVDEKQQTSLPDICAVGDYAMVRNALTGKPQWSAMGSTANITGRCLARNLSGHEAIYGGCLGTGVVRLLDGLNAGRTGLTEAQAKDAGYDPVTVFCITDDKAHYYPGADSFYTKLIADRATHKLLGIQVLGAGAVDKMVDIAVTGISLGAKLEDFDTLDFAYAPPSPQPSIPSYRPAIFWKTNSAEHSRPLPRRSMLPEPLKTTRSSMCSPPPPFPAPGGSTWPRSTAPSTVWPPTINCCWSAPRANGGISSKTGSRPAGTPTPGCWKAASPSTS